MRHSCSSDITGVNGLPYMLWYTILKSQLYLYVTWQLSLRPTMDASPVWRPGPSQCRDVLPVWGSPCWRWDGLVTVFSLLWGSSYLGGRSLHWDGARLVFTCTSYLLSDDQRWRESVLTNDVLDDIHGTVCMCIYITTLVFVNNIQVKSGVELMSGIRVPGVSRKNWWDQYLLHSLVISLIRLGTSAIRFLLSVYLDQ